MCSLNWCVAFEGKEPLNSLKPLPQSYNIFENSKEFIKSTADGITGITKEVGDAIIGIYDFLKGCVYYISHPMAILGDLWACWNANCYWICLFLMCGSTIAYVCGYKKEKTSKMILGSLLIYFISKCLNTSLESFFDYFR